MGGYADVPPRFAAKPQPFAGSGAHIQERLRASTSIVHSFVLPSHSRVHLTTPQTAELELCMISWLGRPHSSLRPSSEEVRLGCRSNTMLLRIHLCADRHDAIPDALALPDYPQNEERVKRGRSVRTAIADP